MPPAANTLTLPNYRTVISNMEVIEGVLDVMFAQRKAIKLSPTVVTGIRGFRACQTWLSKNEKVYNSTILTGEAPATTRTTTGKATGKKTAGAVHS